jgi:hypothetical protein
VIVISQNHGALLERFLDLRDQARAAIDCEIVEEFSAFARERWETDGARGIAAACEWLKGALIYHRATESKRGRELYNRAESLKNSAESIFS